MLGLAYRIACRWRDWWGENWLTCAMVSYYLGIGAVGAIGYHDPSISMTRLIGAASAIYATGALGLGMLAVVSAVEGSRRSEAVCIRSIALLTALHGLIVIAGSPDQNGLQTGVRLMCAVPAGFVLAHYRVSCVYTRRDLRRAIAVAERTAAADAARGRR